MHEKRLAIYVTLLDDSKTAEWYAVNDDGYGRTDLEEQGFSDFSTAVLRIADTCLEWRKRTTDG